MEYGFDVMREFDNYCSEKRAAISGMADKEQKACQEKVLVARSLLHQEAKNMVQCYSGHELILNDNGDGEGFEQLQEAVMELVCAGLEDISFNKWKGNIEDAVCRIRPLEQVKRLPRFSNACEKIADSIDIDFSDIEEELRLIFEPECIYNTLVLLVTAVKLYSEIMQGICDNRKNDIMGQDKRTVGKTNHAE